MLQKLKYLAYFPLACYFRFFASLRLKRWQPQIIVITGSSGKTTLLHLLESQLGSKAKYSHQANSSYGIPFDILGLKRHSLMPYEWIWLFLTTPLRALLPAPKEKLYVVEVDCDRPHEGKFLGQFLKPDITLWLNLSKTHCVNFDPLVQKNKFTQVEEAIAFEFSHLIKNTTKKVIANGDNPFILKQLKRTQAEIKLITQKNYLKDYQISASATQFKIKNQTCKFSCLLPQQHIYALAMCLELLKYLNIKPDLSFSKFSLPPGRSSVFKGIKNTSLIDSTYNLSPDSMKAILELYKHYPAKNKWAVLGDMLEQGSNEQVEHEKLAEAIAELKLKQVIFLGPRTSKYTYPKLKSLKPQLKLTKFIYPRDLLDYLQQNIKGGETILFKGVRFLEGVIEHLLADPAKVSQLPRREKIWQLRRNKWGL